MNDGVAVYIVRGLESGLLKIGQSASMTTRMRTLAVTAEPVELLAAFPGSLAVERGLHRRFRHALARGREWFHDDGSIRAFIETLPEIHRGSMSFERVRTAKPKRAAHVIETERRQQWKKYTARVARIAAEHGHAVDLPKKKCPKCWVAWSAYLARGDARRAARAAAAAACPLLYPHLAPLAVAS